MSRLPEPPRAAPRPYRYTRHGISIDDPYHWLRDPAYPDVEDPDILAYLDAENAYFAAVMAPHRSLIDQLYEEIKARQQPDEAAVPWRERGWEYQWRYAPGAQYRCWFRWPAGEPEREALLLDEPTLAAGHDYFMLAGFDVSPDGRWLAYATDCDGSERFTIRIKDLMRDVLLDDVIRNTSGAVVWANDNETLLYVELTDNWRPFRVRAHRRGERVADSAEVYREDSGEFFVAIDKTQSEAYLVVSSGDHVTSETRVIPAATPLAPPRLIAPRRVKHDYDVEHHDEHFYIRSNARHENFELLRAPVATPQEAHWQPVIEGNDHHYLTGHCCFADFLVVEERIDGLDQVRIVDYGGGADHYVAFPEASYDAGLGTNPEFSTRVLRLDYESMVTPQTVYDYAVDARQLTRRKVRRIPSGYDAARYTTERLSVAARDGAQVPVSIVYRNDFPHDGSGALYLYGYGAYGIAMAPHFSSARLSLLDRGLAYAVAHVRGGDDLGYAWYEAGKLEQRTNTFNDFIDVARDLIRRRYTAAGRIVAAGGSAGGTLTGVVANTDPELWGAVVSHVPFVDVLSTILDADLPLTRLEWPEWGNPLEDAAAFRLIRSYSPYDQISAQRYPPMLVTAGLNDPRVTYWEAAKYVAKLRATKTDDNLLLLKTNMGAGHGGKSGRWEALQEIAEEFAFVLVSLRVE